jgi:hypothetical protein
MLGNSHIIATLSHGANRLLHCARTVPQTERQPSTGIPAPPAVFNSSCQSQHLRHSHLLLCEARPGMGRRRPAMVHTPPCALAAALVVSMKAATPLK